MTDTATKIDVVSFIMEVEDTGFDQDREGHVEALQHMIDTGLAFRLQGSWGRFARRAIEAGIVNPPS